MRPTCVDAVRGSRSNLQAATPAASSCAAICCRAVEQEKGFAFSTSRLVGMLQAERVRKSRCRTTWCVRSGTGKTTCADASCTCKVEDTLASGSGLTPACNRHRGCHNPRYAPIGGRDALTGKDCTVMQGVPRTHSGKGRHAPHRQSHPLSYSLITAAHYYYSIILPP